MSEQIRSDETTTGTGAVGPLDLKPGSSVSGDLRRELDRIKSIHNAIRDELFKDDAVARHFVNENTLVRVAALLDSEDFKPGGTVPDDPSSMEKWDVCVWSVFFLRDLILHKGGRVCELQYQFDKRLAICNEFYGRCNLQPIKMKDDLPLGGKEVLTPLINGCIDYVKRRESSMRRRRRY